MKIAYLMHTKQELPSIMKVINELVKQDDHVFIMVDDNKERDDFMIAYSHDRRVHVSHTQEFAQEGDMSLARGTLLQMKEAIEYKDAEFDYFINLYDGMLALKPRDEIVAFLEQNPGDYYEVEKTEQDDPSLKKEAIRYYGYTNMLDFPTKQKYRKKSKHLASFLYFLHIRRKLDDPVQLGSPWFILSSDTCKVLAEHFAYCSEYFKLSWYAEEMVIPMMITKYLSNPVHVNDDKRVVGPDGCWVHSQGIRPISEEVLNRFPDALYGGAILDTEQPELFEQILPIYNSTYQKPYEVPIDNSGFNHMVDSLANATIKVK